MTPPILRAPYLPSLREVLHVYTGPVPTRLPLLCVPVVLSVRVNTPSDFAVAHYSGLTGTFPHHAVTKQTPHNIPICAQDRTMPVSLVVRSHAPAAVAIPTGPVSLGMGSVRSHGASFSASGLARFRVYRIVKDYTAGAECSQLKICPLVRCRLAPSLAAWPRGQGVD